MPTGFLSETERARLDRFPEDISQADLIQYFTLTPAADQHLAIKHAVNLALLDILTAAGVSAAFPSSSVYFETPLTVETTTKTT